MLYTDLLRLKPRLLMPFFEDTKERLTAILTGRSSGKELLERGFAADIQFASELNVSAAVPMLVEGAYENIAKPLPDPDDEPFLEVALEGQAEALVTGNLKNFPKSATRRLAVLAPHEFLDWLR